LRRLVGSLPADFPAALLAVLHTGPTSPRLLAEIIGLSTSLKVAYAQNDEEVQVKQVLLAPPDTHMTVRPPGIVSLDHGPKIRHARPAVDRLFESVAHTYGARAIGIVMSGGDHDGTDGIEAIKAAGGLAIVQDPCDAYDPQMPFSAVRDDHPNFIAPIEEIGLLLKRLVLA
jgi:two-component system chemotaxis response regulator CheB